MKVLFYTPDTFVMFQASLAVMTEIIEFSSEHSPRNTEPGEFVQLYQWFLSQASLIDGDGDEISNAFISLARGINGAPPQVKTMITNGMRDPDTKNLVYGILGTSDNMASIALKTMDDADMEEHVRLHKLLANTQGNA